MDRIIMARCGELMLKGLNRSYFESTLLKNLKTALEHAGNCTVTVNGGRVYIEPTDEEFSFGRAMEAVSRVFGIVSLSPVYRIETDYGEICRAAVGIAAGVVERQGYRTFKVETKRANKNFPMESPEINREIGAEVLRNVGGLSVDVHQPDFVLNIEIRDKTYIFWEVIPAHGGLPVGTNGKAALLISGGIDSPVAGWMMAKRGVELEAIHFYSYPYTSERAKEKVIELTRILSAYCGKIRLHIVPFTDIQLEIINKCPQDEGTLIMRRYMMKIANILARKNNCQALITGESMGQVASQTMMSLAVTDSAADMPVFRPLIGMDKEEVVQVARKIGTYETSILPYEDCCTIFVAKHPKTRPVLDKIIESETALDERILIDKAVAGTEVMVIRPG